MSQSPHNMANAEPTFSTNLQFFYLDYFFVSIILNYFFDRPHKRLKYLWSGLEGRRYVPVLSGRSDADWLTLLRCYCSVTPSEDFVQTCGFVVCDLGEDPCAPGLGIDVFELGGFDQGIGDCCGITATPGADRGNFFCLKPHSGSIFPQNYCPVPDGHSSDSRTFSLCGPEHSDGFGALGFSGNTIELGVQSGF